MTIIEALLAAVLIIQQLFWMYVTQKLVNKLMSRDFTEYTYAQRKPPTQKKASTEEIRVRLPQDELGILDGLT